jgi:hypothetical protein
MDYNNYVYQQDGDDPSVQQSLDKTFIYPLVAVFSAGPIPVTSDYYFEFGDTLFTVYYSIYSTKKKSNYILDFSAFNMSGTGENVTKLIHFDSLTDDYFKKFMASMALIFGDYKRHVLNFDKGKKMNLNEYLRIIKEWLPKDSGEDFLGEEDII